MNARVYSELSYNEYIYPDWAVAIGWCLAVSSAVWIPVVAIWNIIKYMKQGIVRITEEFNDFRYASSCAFNILNACDFQITSQIDK